MVNFILTAVLYINFINIIKKSITHPMNLTYFCCLSILVSYV